MAEETKDVNLFCPVCGEPIWRNLCVPLFDGNGGTKEIKVHRMCRCERDKKDKYEKRIKFEEEQRKIDKLRNLSLIDVKLSNVRFQNYKITSENQRMFNIAKRYVDNFDDMLKKHQGLLFWGGVGTGKSYTAAAIANELIDRMYSAVMTSFIKLINELMRFGSDDNEKRLSAADYIQRLNQAQLLVIDDLGAERGTDFALEKVYDIIDSRYRSGKPIILTTNLEMSYMKNCDDIRYNRIYDRIFEMCYPVKVDGKSWRKKEAAIRFTDTKKILES